MAHTPPGVAALGYESATDPAPAPRGLLGQTAYQWKAGIAAWLGWMFDGLDMHLYTLVAAPFVAQLMTLAPGDPAVKQKSSIIQGAFLLGWALGGGVFGRLGDKLGRSRALGLTILTYAAFTGLSVFAQTWWELMIFRFLAALGIGGEWAVGSSLLSETWPPRWRAWVAAVLQTAVNIGVLVACGVNFLLAGHNRYVFLVGVLPALAVFWIRRAVPEPDEWRRAKAAAGPGRVEPGLGDLFRGPTRRTTLLTIAVCSFSLTAWWAFMFWYTQEMRGLKDLAGWSAASLDRLVSVSFFAMIGWSIAGNFFAAFVARRVGYRKAIALMCLAFCVVQFEVYRIPRGHVALLWLTPWVGFCSGVFGLFTMYLPPLFPTLLRSTGAGFSYNIGRVASAVGVVLFGLYAKVSLNADALRLVLKFDSLLFIPALGFALMLPDLVDPKSDAVPAPTEPLE
jgi:predicted MFS family arabinose efflux permease